MKLRGSVTYGFPAIIPIARGRLRPRFKLSATVTAQGSWSNDGLGFGRPTGIIVKGYAGSELGNRHLGKVGNESKQAQLSATVPLGLSKGQATGNRLFFNGTPVQVEFHGTQNRYVTLTPIYEATKLPPI